MNTNDEIPASNAVDDKQTDKPVKDDKPKKAKPLPVATDPQPDETVKKKKTNRAKPKKQPRQGVRFGTVFVCSVLAALLGAAGGTAITYSLMKMDKFPASASSQTDNKAALSAVAALKDDVATLQARVNAPVDNDTVDLSPLIARLEALEARPLVTEDGRILDPSLVARIDALETAPPAELPAIDLTAIENRLAKLETDASEQAANDEASPEVLSSDIIARIEVLEQRDETVTVPADLTPLQEQLGAVESRTGTLEAEMTSRFEALEMRASTLEAEAAEALRSAVPIPAFPKTAVLDALSSAGAEDQGFFKRTVGKHIKVQNENAIKRVSEIEALITKGDIDTALAHIKTLPQPGQDAAAGWVKTVNDIRSAP